MEKFYQMFEGEWTLCFQGFYMNEEHFLDDAKIGYNIDITSDKYEYFWQCLDNVCKCK